MISGAAVNVLDYGAVGDGVADDLATLEAARDAAYTAGKTLYFPDGVYGISEVFLFKGNVYFELGASIKLLNATAGGGAVGVCDATTITTPVWIDNITVDASDIPGENALGITHPIGAVLNNVTIKNCKYDEAGLRAGGKAIQAEGLTNTRAIINGLTMDNCSIGMDFQGLDPATKRNTHIYISNVSMRNVDVPVYLHEEQATTPVNTRQTFEVVIDGIIGRNCGRASWPGSTALGVGIITCDRGSGLTVRNMQIVNDDGTGVTDAYGGIGALVRGTMYDVVLENVLIEANMTSVFDFNYCGLPSVATNSIASYVMAADVKVYGNLDYVVYTKAGGGTLGAGSMTSIEVGSTVATIAEIVESNASAYTNTVLEVIDRDQAFVSTGVRTLKQIYDTGNAVTGANGTVGQQITASPTRSWVPVVDATSGAITTLGSVTGTYSVVGNLVFAFFDVTITTNGAGAGTVRIGGLPISSTTSASGSGFDTLTDKQLSLERIGETQFYLRFYDGTYAGADGAHFTGCYVYIQP